MGYVIATANMKGGVGKTTVTVNLATCLAKHHGKRVLVVDLDTQINATLSMMSPTDFTKLRRDKRTIRQLIHAAILPRGNKISDLLIDIIHPYVGQVKGLDLLPGDIDLYDEFIVAEILHEKALRNSNYTFEDIWNRFERTLVESILLPVIDTYDFIILDCAPGYNLITRSSLLASDFYILPAKPEPLSLIGIQLIERRIAKLKEIHKLKNPATIELLGIVFTMSSSLLAGRYYKQVMQRVHQDYSDAKIFKTQIPTDVNVSKAVDCFLPVTFTEPNSSGAKAFASLSQEFLEKLETVTGVVQLPKLNLAALD